jgi:hypothetical protein
MYSYILINWAFLIFDKYYNINKWMVDIVSTLINYYISGLSNVSAEYGETHFISFDFEILTLWKPIISVVLLPDTRCCGFWKITLSSRGLNLMYVQISLEFYLTIVLSIHLLKKIIFCKILISLCIKYKSTS